MLGLSHEHDGPGAVRGSRRPRPRRRARSRRRSRTGRATRRVPQAPSSSRIGPTSTPPRQTPVSRHLVGRRCWPTSRSAGTAPPPWQRSPPNRSRRPWACSPPPGHSSSPTPSTCATASPLLWKRVRRLEVPAWQARRVARQTHRLSKAAAIWVDQQVADRGTCGPVIVDRLVAQAIAAYDPETTEDREDEAQAGWDVTLARQPHRLPRHLPPRRHRRHPGPQRALRPGLAASPTSCTSTATPARSESADQGPRHPHRPTHHHGHPRRSRSTPASKVATWSPEPSP